MKTKAKTKASSGRQLRGNLDRRIATALTNLRTLRDEIRLDLHLAGMEARERWHALESQLPEAERAASEIRESTHDAIERTVRAFRAFRAELRRTPANEEHTGYPR